MTSDKEHKMKIFSSLKADNPLKNLGPKPMGTFIDINGRKFEFDKSRSSFYISNSSWEVSVSIALPDGKVTSMTYKPSANILNFIKDNKSVRTPLYAALKDYLTKSLNTYKNVPPLSFKDIQQIFVDYLGISE
jgi:hypothetical protein